MSSNSDQSLKGKEDEGDKSPHSDNIEGESMANSSISTEARSKGEIEKEGSNESTNSSEINHSPRNELDTAPATVPSPTVSQEARPISETIARNFAPPRQAAGRELVLQGQQLAPLPHHAAQQNTTNTLLQHLLPNTPSQTNNSALQTILLGQLQMVPSSSLVTLNQNNAATGLASAAAVYGTNNTTLATPSLAALQARTSSQSMLLDQLLASAAQPPPILQLSLLEQLQLESILAQNQQRNSSVGGLLPLHSTPRPRPPTVNQTSHTLPSANNLLHQVIGNQISSSRPFVASSAHQDQRSIDQVVRDLLLQNNTAFLQPPPARGAHTSMANTLAHHHSQNTNNVSAVSGSTNQIIDLLFQISANNHQHRSVGPENQSATTAAAAAAGASTSNNTASDNFSSESTRNQDIVAPAAAVALSERSSIDPVRSNEGTSARGTIPNVSVKIKGTQKEKWMDRFKELRQFRQEHGHSRVPHGYKQNTQLSWWVMNQRAQYKSLLQGKKTWLTEERISLLNEIDFEWSPCAGKRPKKREK